MKEKERLTSGSSGCTPSEDAAQASLPDRQHDHKSDDDIYIMMTIVIGTCRGWERHQWDLCTWPLDHCLLLAPAQHHYGDGADHGGGDDDDDEKEGGDDGERQLRRRQACPFCQYYLETHPGAVYTHKYFSSTLANYWSFFSN